MEYDLDTLEQYAVELGFTVSRRSAEELVVEVGGAHLVFSNRADHGHDGIVYFEGTSWHEHGRFFLPIGGSGECLECDELDVVRGLRMGDILILEQFENDRFTDRWLVHRSEKRDFSYMQPGEETRIRRLSE